MPTPWKRVGERIKVRRLELRLSQHDAAARAGISEASWNVIENGRTDSYRDRTIVGVCDALGWTPESIDRLLAGNEPRECAAPSAEVHGSPSLTVEGAPDADAIRDLLGTKLAAQLKDMGDSDIYSTIRLLLDEISRRHLD